MVNMMLHYRVALPPHEKGITKMDEQEALHTEMVQGTLAAALSKPSMTSPKAVRQLAWVKIKNFSPM